MRTESARQPHTAAALSINPCFGRLMQVLGIILCLGGLGHTIGVTRFYIMQGIPDTNRVLLDIWIAEAQLFGGALYLAAYRALRLGRSWRALAVCGALTVISYAGPFIPVLFSRDPIAFRIPPTIYFLLSLFVLIRAVLARAR